MKSILLNALRIQVDIDRYNESIALGSTDEEAFPEAIEEFGDLRCLAKEMSIKRVNKSAVVKRFSLYSYLLIALN